MNEYGTDVFPEFDTDIETEAMEEYDDTFDDLSDLDESSLEAPEIEDTYELADGYAEETGSSLSLDDIDLSELDANEEDPVEELEYVDFDELNDQDKSTLEVTESEDTNESAGNYAEESDGDLVSIDSIDLSAQDTVQEDPIDELEYLDLSGEDNSSEIGLNDVDDTIIAEQATDAESSDLSDDSLSNLDNTEGTLSELSGLEEDASQEINEERDLSENSIGVECNDGLLIQDEETDIPDAEELDHMETMPFDTTDAPNALEFDNVSELYDQEQIETNNNETMSSNVDELPVNDEDNLSEGLVNSGERNTVEFVEEESQNDLAEQLTDCGDAVDDAFDNGNAIEGSLEEQWESLDNPTNEDVGNGPQFAEENLEMNDEHVEPSDSINDDESGHGDRLTELENEREYYTQLRDSLVELQAEQDGDSDNGESSIHFPSDHCNITEEANEIRSRDINTILENYRENLRARGVSESAIEDFVNEERESMQQEYQAIDRGDENVPIYHTPTDWEAIANSLSQQDYRGEAESLEELPAEQQAENEANELPVNINYDEIYEGVSPETLESGFNNIDIDEDPDRLEQSLSDFTTSEWENLSLDEQKRAMNDLADYVKDIIGFENPPHIEYYNNPEQGDYGGYSPSTNTLRVNEYMLYENDEAADTIAHELWHAHQHELASNPRTARDYQYQYNFDNYISPSLDPKGYRDQLVEAEARAFANQFKERLSQLKGRTR